MSAAVVVHETPGLIDVRSFTTFGINSKPCTASPIGYFGTGLKYAIAVLCRQGCAVTVWIGEEPHVFRGEKMIFRDREFLQLRMRRRRGVTARWMSVELPYTTELGRNWEIWMALRELHSNTLDEGGRSWSLPEDPYQRRYRLADDGTTESTDADEWGTDGIPGTTRIVVEGEAYHEAFSRLGEIFLRGAVREAQRCGVQQLPGRSRYAYWRGLRVGDLPRESVWTWNLTGDSIVLTEDRTMKYPYFVPYFVALWVMTSTDRAAIRAVLEAPEETFEGSIQWDSHGHTPTTEFVETARLYGRRSALVIVRQHDAATEASWRPRTDWRVDLLSYLRGADDEATARKVREYAAPLRLLLEADLERTPAQDMVPVALAGEPSAKALADDIPF